MFISFKNKNLKMIKTNEINKNPKNGWFEIFNKNE